MPALKPYRGKPAVRNFRGGNGNVGIIESRSAPLPYRTVAKSRTAAALRDPCTDHSRLPMCREVNGIIVELDFGATVSPGTSLAEAAIGGPYSVPESEAHRWIVGRSRRMCSPMAHLETEFSSVELSHGGLIANISGSGQQPLFSPVCLQTRGSALPLFSRIG